MESVGIMRETSSPPVVSDLLWLLQLIGLGPDMSLHNALWNAWEVLD